MQRAVRWSLSLLLIFVALLPLACSATPAGVPPSGLKPTDQQFADALEARTAEIARLEAERVRLSSELEVRRKFLDKLDYLLSRRTRLDEFWADLEGKYPVSNYQSWIDQRQSVFDQERAALELELEQVNLELEGPGSSDYYLRQRKYGLDEQLERVPTMPEYFEGVEYPPWVGRTEPSDFGRCLDPGA